MAKKSLTKKEARERSRRKLINATIRGLRRSAPGSLTTTSIAKTAGLSQPSFYLHFDGVDEALKVAAEEVAAKIHEVVRAARLEVLEESSLSSVKKSHGTAVRALLENREFTELYLMYRRDKVSPVGRVMQRLSTAFRHEVVEDLRKHGFTDDVVGDVDLYADMLIATTIAVVEAILDGRVTDEEEAILALSRAGSGILHGLANP